MSKSDFLVLVFHYLAMHEYIFLSQIKKKNQYNNLYLEGDGTYISRFIFILYMRDEEKEPRSFTFC